MKHFDTCRCEQCRTAHPSRAMGSCGFLMQQILSNGQQHLRCKPFCLALGPLPRNLISPLRITHVSVEGNPIVRDVSLSCHGNTQQAHIIIPLAVTVCDSRGQTHTTQSEICVTVPLQACVHTCHADDAQHIVNALVRFHPSCDTFDPGDSARVLLDICIQVFLVALRPVYSAAPCAPVCPDLPLYPQPCRPSARPW